MSSDHSCVFCKIISGKIPCARVYEDQTTLSFVDIGPLAEGHLLVVPKTHHERLHDMPAADLAAVASTLPRLARAMMVVTGASAYNVLQNNGPEAGQVVPHVHFHLIPRRRNDGLGYRWNAGTYPESRADELAKLIADAVADQSQLM
jgi:histidine triad (HIT) family protein